MTDALRRAPVWAWLVGLVLVSALVRLWLARRMVAPWIVIDEIVYSELAKSFAATGRFTIRDVPAGGAYGVVYPVLISPAFLLESIPSAYAAVKAINAVAISLAAVPAYLLGRRVLSPWAALAAAALTVAVPSMFYAGTVMTENAFYPVFLLAVLALVLALERPTALRVALLLGAVGLAYLTRAQAVVFLPAIATAPLLLAAWERRFRWRNVYLGLVAGALAVLAAAAARGRTPLDLLGAYRAAGEQDYHVREVLRWLLRHVAELDLYVGIAPFAALLVLLAVGRSLEPRDRAFLAGATAVTVWLLLQVAAFASQPSVQRIEERNMFYAAPLFFVALLLWLERGAPRPPVPTALAAGAAALLPAVLDYPRLIDVPALSDTLAMLPLWTLHEAATIPLDRGWLVVTGGAVLIALLFALLPRPRLLVLPGIVAALYLVAMPPVEERMQAASVGALFQGITHPDRDWVDRAVGPDADVAVVWTGAPDRLVVNQNEFFSRSVGPVFYLREPVPGGLAQTPVRVDAEDGYLRDPDGAPVEAAFVLVHTSLPLLAAVRDADEHKGMLLYELDGPARVPQVAEGLYDDGWTEPRFAYRGFGCERDRTLVVTLGSDPKLFRRPQTVTARTGGRELARTRVDPRDEDGATLRVPLPADCRVSFDVSPTATPADVQAGSDDTRELGVRVLAWERR